MARNALLDTQPTNAGERFAYIYSAAQTIRQACRARWLQKAFGLGGGVVGGWGAGETARFLNAPDYDQRRGSPRALGGGIVGGAASGFRRTPGGPAPTGIDPA